jgi:hypothetical protein
MFPSRKTYSGFCNSISPHRMLCKSSNLCMCTFYKIRKNITEEKNLKEMLSINMLGLGLT